MMAVTGANDNLIATTLHTFLTTQLQSSGPARCFFRLDGFDEAVYRGLLECIRAEGSTLAGHPLWVRTHPRLRGLRPGAGQIRHLVPQPRPARARPRAHL